MTKFEYDKDGNLIAVRDGKKVGEIVSMGDVIEDRPTEEVKKDER